MALARKVWGKRFQVLVATHMNTDNLHNHFVINSVSYVDGKKYEQRRSQYAEFRAASDKLCREYGLSVVEQPKAKEPARYARMREAIDQACEGCQHRRGLPQGFVPAGVHQEKVRTKIQNHCLQRLQGQRAETHEGADHHCAIIRAKAWHPAICHGKG